MSANTGALNFTLGLQANQFLNSLGVASGKLLAFTGVATSINSAFDKMWGAIQKGARLTDLAAGASLTVKDLYRLQMGFKNVGAEAEAVPGVINRLRRTLTGGEQNSLLASMGLDPAAIAKMDPADQFAKIATAMGKLNVNARSQAATALFGREGAQTIQQIANSGNDFAGAMERATKDADVWQKVSGAFDAISDKVAEIEAHITTLWAKLAGGLVQAFKEGTLAQTIFDLFSAVFQALGAALPNLLAAGLVAVGQALLDVLRVPIAYMQTAFDGTMQRWMLFFSKIPGLRDAMGIPNGFTPERWSDILARNKERGYEFFPGMNSDSGGFVADQMAKAAAAAQPFLDKIGATFDGLINRLDSTPGPLVGEDGKDGAWTSNKLSGTPVTNIEKMGGIIHGLGRGFSGDDAAQTAKNTWNQVSVSRQILEAIKGLKPQSVTNQ